MCAGGGDDFLAAGGEDFFTGGRGLRATLAVGKRVTLASFAFDLRGADLVTGLDAGRESFLAALRLLMDLSLGVLGRHADDPKLARAVDERAVVVPALVLDDHDVGGPAGRGALLDAGHLAAHRQPVAGDDGPRVFEALLGLEQVLAGGEHQPLAQIAAGAQRGGKGWRRHHRSVTRGPRRRRRPPPRRRPASANAGGFGPARAAGMGVVPLFLSWLRGVFVGLLPALRSPPVSSPTRQPADQERFSAPRGGGWV